MKAWIPSPARDLTLPVVWRSGVVDLPGRRNDSSEIELAGRRDECSEINLVGHCDAFAPVELSGRCSTLTARLAGKPSGGDVYIRGEITVTVFRPRMLKDLDGITLGDMLDWTMYDFYYTEVE